MKICTVVGARPQFIKLAPVSRAIRSTGEEFILHTGQHYDLEMSKLFFEDLEIPTPDLNLNIGSGTHGWQTAQMLMKIENVLNKIKPDIVIVFGDTNSTLAGAIASAKLHIPVAHIEAGLRSFNMQMPEEVNRIITDHISDILFCPSKASVEQLKSESIRGNIILTGDVMYDALRHFSPIAQEKSNILRRLELVPRSYHLLTVHRAENTDKEERIREIFIGISKSNKPVVFPVHPRTQPLIKKYNSIINENIVQIIEPVGFLDMIELERHASIIITDSGGIQKEAYLLRVPCITLRDETEWVETVHSGWNCLVGASYDKIIYAINNPPEGIEHQNYYGDGNASTLIFDSIQEYLERSNDKSVPFYGG